MKLFFSRAVCNFIKYDCISCSSATQKNQIICAACYNNLLIINQNSTCNKCGRYSLTEICLFCKVNPPLFTQAKAFCNYEDISSKIIKNFKYYNNTLCKKFIASQMRNIHEKTLIHYPIDIITTVPMNSFKEYLKGYNHTTQITKEIFKDYNISPTTDILIKKFTLKRQATSAKKERLQNIQNTFTINKKYNIKGKNILLIDDIFTTGATANECTKVLLENGGNNVYILTFAKSIADEQMLVNSTHY